MIQILQQGIPGCNMDEGCTIPTNLPDSILEGLGSIEGLLGTQLTPDGALNIDSLDSLTSGLSGWCSGGNGACG
jgi:hypothetical protein